MTARQTSAECYSLIQPKTETDRNRIAELVRNRGPMTRREIAGFLHMETSSVSGRVNELMRAEPPVLIELDSPQPCPVTKRRVTWLAHADDMPGYQRSLFQ